jgi:hypothetical protein
VIDLLSFSKLEALHPSEYAKIIRETDVLKVMVKLREGAFIPCYVQLQHIVGELYTALVEASLLQVFEDDPDILVMTIAGPLQLT